GVGQCEQELRIIGGQPLPLVHFADVVTDGQSQVPDRVEELVEEALVRLGNRSCEENQEIDIGMQAQLPPAVASEGENANQLRRNACVREELLNEGVNPL